MDTTILTALVAAGAACVGALIPSLFSLLSKKQDYKNERKSKIEEIQRMEYIKYIEALQTMVNTSSIENFLPLQASTNRLLLFSGQILSEKINNYYNELVFRTNNMNPLTQDEHTKYITEIINAMREDLGISDKKLEKVLLIKVGNNKEPER